MATVKQGILGGFSGKIGNIVGSSWKGIAVMKVKPISVANPRTAGQVAQRGKFANVTAVATSLLAVLIKPFWDRFASGMSGYNDFVSTNIALFENPLISDPTAFVISKGKMAATSISLVTLAGSSIKVEWVNDAGSGYKTATDIPVIVVSNGTDFLAFEAGVGVVRSTGALTTPIGSIPTMFGIISAVYLAFKRADGTVVSNTSYSAVV